MMWQMYQKRFSPETCSVRVEQSCTPAYALALPTLMLDYPAKAQAIGLWKSRSLVFSLQLAIQEINAHNCALAAHATERLLSRKTKKRIYTMENSEFKPLVSIIAPMYNLEPFIDETIESVLAQTYQNFELILVDDSSSDDTVKKVQEFKDPRIRLIVNEKNQGAGRTRNRGIEIATGDYIALLDADDLWYPHKLQTQIEFMTSNNVAFSYTLYDVMDKYGRVYAGCGHVPSNATYHKILRRNFIRTSSVIYEVKRLEGVIYFPTIRKRQDMLFFLALIKKTGPARLLNNVTCSYRMHPGSISSNKRSLIPYQWNAYRHQERLSLAYSSFLMAAWFALAGTATLQRRWKETKTRRY